MEEKIYEDAGFDIPSFIKGVLDLSVEEIEDQQHDIIKGFPNQYCFSKTLGEKYLKQELGDIPCLIFRPSMIGAAYK